METDRRSGFQRAAHWVAETGVLPTSGAAVLGYYADTGVLDYSSILLKRRVDTVIGSIIADTFEAIEQGLEAAFGVPSVEFAYDTKLVLPAQLTLGYLYRTLPEVNSRLPGLRRVNRHEGRAHGEGDGVARAEAITALIVEALIEGDIRDAINDDEYGDFEVNFDTSSVENGRRVAEVAQRVLQESIDRRFEEFPEGVLEAYSWAVEVSERHQAKDEYFRELLVDAPDAVAQEQIRAEYKFAKFDAPPRLFNAEELELPYFKTQYRRVGVIYDGMIEMYRAAGFSVSEEFKKSIIFAIIGAQIWLDDVDDFATDRIEGQLTPVIAEYAMSDDPRKAYENTVRITEEYLELAKQYAVTSGTHLTGIAVEYIYRSGDPTHLPRS